MNLLKQIRDAEQALKKAHENLAWHLLDQGTELVTKRTLRSVLTGEQLFSEKTLKVLEKSDSPEVSTK